MWKRNEVFVLSGVFKGIRIIFTFLVIFMRTEFTLVSHAIIGVAAEVNGSWYHSVAISDLAGTQLSY